jgi:anti-sigma regulatory factor (Ser/Thr protein kinase)
MCQGLGARTADTAQLLVSELVTHAVVHGKGRIGLRIARDKGMLRVEISDGDAENAPGLHALSDPHAETGRGEFLLEALASAWGTVPAGQHGPKTTWFELN